MQNFVNQEVGNYRLIRVLGEGGFARVYLGEHIHLGTLAALKIHYTRFEETEREHFEQEARTIARLTHPHIVRVLDYGVQDGVAFLVMDYASRGTLRQLHPPGTVVPLETVVQYVKQIAAALQYAHDQKLVHRDVKPENMLLNTQQLVLLSDFGIAVAAHSTHSLGTQDAIGTVLYMAPEQLRKKARPASDQYALATIAYEWLCGTPPFVGLPIEVALQHLIDPIPPLCDKLPDLPRPVEQVLLRALAKEPEQRFPSIQAFADALEQAAQGHTAARRDLAAKTVQEEVPAPEQRKRGRETPDVYSPAWKFWPSRRRGDPVPQRLMVRTIGILLLAILGFGALGTWGFSNTRNHVDMHLPGQPTTVPTFASAPILPVGASPASPASHASPGDWVEPGFDAQNTNNNSSEHLVTIGNVASLRPLRQTPATSLGTMVTYGTAFAVAHGIIYFADGSSLVEVNAHTGKVLRNYPLPVHSNYVSTPVIIGNQVYITSGNGDFLALNLQTGATVAVGAFDLSVSGLNIPAPVAADGIIYGVVQLQELYAIDTRTNTFLWQTPLSDVTTTSAVGNGVVYVAGYQHVYALDEHTGKILWQSRTESTGNTGVGSQFISGFYAPVVGSQYVYATEDQQVLAYPRQCTTPCAPAWSFPARYIFRSGPAFANGVVYATTGDWDDASTNMIYALDGRTGKVLWSAPNAPANAAVITPPIIANGIIYLTDWFADVTAYPASGCGAHVCQPLWNSMVLDNGQDGRAVSRIVDGYLYTLTTTGKLVAFGLSGCRC